jgi:type I restriction enzyme S subunit
MAKYRFDQIAINSTEKKKPVEEDRFTYLGLEHLDSGTLKVTRFGSEVAPIGEKLVMHRGDVLFGKRRAYQKKVAIAPFDGIFSAHGMVLRPKEDVIDKNFFPLFISSDYFLDAAIKISVGSLSPTINWRDLKELEFELPDMDTQRKLAEVLWSINDTMEAYKRLISATDELVKSQFMEQFGDPNSNPLSWPTATIGEICDIKSGTTLPAAKENEGGEIAYIKVADMNIPGNEKYITTSTKFVSATTAGNGVFPIGTVVFPKNGAAVATNKKRITHVPTCVDLNTMGVTPRIKIDEQYLYLWFQLLNLDSISLVSAIPQISAKTMGAQVIMLPPLDLQEQFAAFVQQSDKSKFELEQALSELAATYKRIIAENLG